MESVPSLSGNHHATNIKISDSSFIENNRLNFAPVIVELWKDGIIESKNEHITVIKPDSDKEVFYFQGNDGD